MLQIKVTTSGTIYSNVLTERQFVQTGMSSLAHSRERANATVKRVSSFGGEFVFVNRKRGSKRLGFQVLVL